MSGSQFALLYNDRSVLGLYLNLFFSNNCKNLENHHASASFRLLRDEDKNILQHFSGAEFREFRNTVIEISELKMIETKQKVFNSVLATDMSTHFVQIKTMKNMLSLPEG